MRQAGRALVLAAVPAFVTLFAPRAEAACAGRPTDPGGVQGYAYGNAAVKAYSTDHISVHYAGSGPHAPDLASKRADGVPDTVAYAAEVGEEALAKYAAMGYRAIPSDMGCPSNGGSDKVDIYLVHFAAADGSTVAECSGRTCSSFALVEAAFGGHGYANPEEGFRTVVTHELFHAVQNTYKTNDDSFWAEGSAQWAMHAVHPEFEDFTRQLTGFFKDPTRSIDAAPTGVTASFLYGSAVWPLYLAQNHGEAVIREVFEAEANGQPALVATDAVLQTKGTSLAQAYPRFAAWNVATGKLAGPGGYPDAAKYPGVAVRELADGVSDITSGLGYFAYRGTLEGPRMVTLDTDAARNGGVVVPIEAGVPNLTRMMALPTNAEGEVLVVVAGTTTKKTDAPFTVRLSPESAALAPTHPAGDGGCSVGSRAVPESAAPLAVALAILLGRRRKR